MLELDDSVLLKEYVERGSEEAFAALVARHVNKVYSIALRHTRNAHQAEEITQAVFVLLAKKSRQLSKRVVLSGWLCRTARLSAVTFVRGEIRRTRREQEAHMQNLLNETESDVWPQVAPLLDAAMAGLSEADHDALALRFFDGKSMKEIGAALGTSEDAVKMRVNRAVEKLRLFFIRRGIVCSAAALTAAISANAVHAAPIGLVVTISTAAALSGTAIATTATTTATKAIALITAPKALVAGIAAVALTAGVGIYVLQQLTAATPVAAEGADSKAAGGAGALSNGLPIRLANDSFNVGPGAFSDSFINEIDADMRRTTNSAPAGHIRSLAAPTSNGSADYLRAAPAAMAPGPTASRFVVYPITLGSSLLGKRIRVSGWMKAQDVGNWAGVSLTVANLGGHIFASDQASDRPIHGTTGWQPVAMVTDIPNEPCFIYLAPTLHGSGEIWCDDFQIDLAAPETPITDDRCWAVWSLHPNDYSETIDPNVTREGRPAFRITYKAGEIAPKNAFVWWGKHNRDPETFRPYLGKTVRMSVWARTENVSLNCGLNLEPKGPNGKRLADHSARGKRQIRGTTDWAEHSVTCWIPKETQDFQTGFFMFRDGTLWLDMATFKCEIVDTPPPATELPTSASRDITQPGDLIFASSGNSRRSEGVANAIDNNKNTKYLNWDSGRDGNEIGTFSPSGFAVQPAVGPTVVTGMGIQSANDASDRDPDVVVLEGSNEPTLTSYYSGTWTPITTISDIAAGFTKRFQSQEFFFSNSIPYRNYRWRVEATRIMPNKCCMQVAEVWLLTSTPTNQATSPAAAGLSR
jgi:RNA polymerase sigma factor (sigma-70 family)